MKKEQTPSGNISFVVYGEPVPKARARVFFNKKANRVMSYTPKKTMGFEQLVATEAVKWRPSFGLIMTGITINIKIYKPIPKSMSKKKRDLAEKGLILPITRPDGDNYEKGIFDALKGVIWHDDGQIVDCHWQKFFSVTPRVEVTIQPK